MIAVIRMIIAFDFLKKVKIKNNFMGASQEDRTHTLHTFTNKLHAAHWLREIDLAGARQQTMH
jgi:hypothetical protein